MRRGSRDVPCPHVYTVQIITCVRTGMHIASAHLCALDARTYQFAATDLSLSPTAIHKDCGEYLAGPSNSGRYVCLRQRAIFSCCLQGGGGKERPAVGCWCVVFGGGGGWHFSLLFVGGGGSKKRKLTVCLCSVFWCSACTAKDASLPIRLVLRVLGLLSTGKLSPLQRETWQ